MHGRRLEESTSYIAWKVIVEYTSKNRCKILSTIGSARTRHKFQMGGRECSDMVCVGSWSLRISYTCIRNPLNGRSEIDDPCVDGWGYLCVCVCFCVSVCHF